MASVKVIGAKGLYTDPNTFLLPPGALVKADNCVIDRSGIIQPRRGFEDTGIPSFAQAVKSFTWFQGKLIGHANDTLFYVNGGTVTNYPGTYTANGTRVRFVQANKNLYIATAQGVYRLDKFDGTPVLSGGLKALQATASQTGTSGFQKANSQVAYRVLWGYRDANKNYVYGVPSQREVISGFANPVSVSVGNLSRAASTVTVTATAHGYSVGNVVYLSSSDGNFASGDKVVATVPDANHFTYTESGVAGASSVATAFHYATRNVSLTITFPSNVTSNHFFRVYRTAVSADAAVDPGDEMGLIYEYVLSASSASTKTYTYVDNVPDSLRGEPLYTNPSQLGISSAYDRPPLCSDIFSHKETLLYANTKQPARQIMTLLSVGGTAGLQSGGIVYPGGAIGIAAGATEGAFQFKLYTTGTPAQNIADTARSLVRVYNTTLAATTLGYSYYLSGPDDAPGIILVERFLGLPDFVPGVENTPSVSWSPNILAFFDIVSLSRTGTDVTVTTVANHGIAVGQTISLGSVAADANFPTGQFVVTAVPSAASFKYTQAGAAVTLSPAPNYWVDVNYADSIKSDSDESPNSVYASQPGLPEAVPLTSRFRVGSATATVVRGVPARNSSFIFTDEGLYRLTGTSVEDFNLQPFDLTIKLVAPDSVASVGNVTFAWTNKGVVPITESGVGRPISGPINKALQDLVAQAPNAVRSCTFAVPYESYQKYILWTVFSDSDSVAGQAFVFDLNSGVWTRWVKQAYFAAVNPSDDKLYVSTPQAPAPSSHLVKERKTLTFADQAEEAIGVNIVSASGTSVTLTDASGVVPGDALWQSNTIWSRVVSVNGAVVTVATTKAWANGSALALKPIPVNIQWAPFTAGEPCLTKHCTEFLPLFQDATNLSSFIAKFSTDLSPDEIALAQTLPSGFTGTGPYRTYVPLEKQRGSLFNISIVHGIAFEIPSIAGFVLVTDGMDTSTSK